MRYPFLDLALTHKPYVDELKAAASTVIESGRYLLGQQTEQLEQQVAILCQTRHCVAVSNGLDALRLILRAYIQLGRLAPGDKVIVPANTYIASVLAVSDADLVPLLCDVNPTTMNLDTQRLAQLLSGEVKAIMPVHLYGTPCWDETLCNMAKSSQLLVIEDNAQAIAAQSAIPGINGTYSTGGLAHAAGISFYPTKNWGALGDAGAVVTNDDEMARMVRVLANYGSDRRYHNICCGYNCRMDELQAALLLVKLRHLRDENQQRRQVASAYTHYIDNELVVVPAIFEGMEQVWHQFVVRILDGRRDEFRSYLHRHGIGTDIHYAVPPHQQPCYPQLRNSRLPVTELLAQQIVSLPIAPPINVEAATEIAGIINQFN